jgi:hypothetical protein
MVDYLSGLFQRTICWSRTMRQNLVFLTLNAVILEVLLLHALLQLTFTMKAGFLKLQKHFHQQQILLGSSLLMSGCLSFSVRLFLVPFYLLLQNLEHIMALILNLMKIFWFLLGKQFNIKTSLLLDLWNYCYPCCFFLSQASSSCIHPLSRQWSYATFISKRFFY